MKYADLRVISPHNIQISIATPAMYETPLFQEEQKYIKHAVKNRQREFSAGRSAAREAMSNFGIKNEAIHINNDRTPKWPDGIVGSITNCVEFCSAAAGLSRDLVGIGFDAKPVEELPTSTLAYILRESEQQDMLSLLFLDTVNWQKLAFTRVTTKIRKAKFK